MKDTVLIALPLKETSETDWIGPLRQYITGIYGTAESYNEDITALNRLRQDVRGSAPDTTGRDIIYRYYGQLELLDLRIPVNEHGCRVSFTWYDSFTHVPITQHSLAFEKASLLYNLASVNSHIGKESDDIKLSYAAFQASAGIYAFVLENFLHAPSSDLLQDTVKALSKLMLAQAQEVFLQRLLQDSNSKPSMTAKIAKGASNMYRVAGEALSSVHTNKSWGERSWYLLAQLKSKYYLAISNDYQAKFLESSDKYGEALAYLNLAIDGLQECTKLIIPIQSQFADFNAILKAYLEAAQLNLKRLDKDNDFIYHEHIPNSATLTEVSGLEAAKPTPMNQLYKENKDISQIIGKELFEKLIPLSVHEKSSLYSEEKASLLRKEGEAVEIADEEMASALEFLDLPASLRIVKSGNSGGDDDFDNGSQDIPSNVQEWASEISGSSSASFTSLENKRQSIYKTIKEAESLINDEYNLWKSSKSELGDPFNQTSSISLSSGISSDIQRIKESLSNGAVSDQTVQKLLNHGTISQDIEILKSGPYGQPLIEAFTLVNPSNSPSSTKSNQPNLLDLDLSADDNNNVNSLISQTEELLTKLNKVSKERKTLFTEFKDRVHKDDISSLLVLNNKVPNIEEKLFKTELEKFQPYQTRLEATIHHQKVLLKDITATWKNVLSNDTVKQKTRSREAVRAQRLAIVARFKTAYNSWKDAQDGLVKGNNFYDNLQSRALSILQNAQQFHQNRGEERERMVGAIRSKRASAAEEQLRQQISSFSLSSPSPHQSFSSPSYGSSRPPAPPAQTSTSSLWDDLNDLNFSGTAPKLPPKPPSTHNSFSNEGGSYGYSSQPPQPLPQQLYQQPPLPVQPPQPPSQFNSPPPAPYTVPSAYTPALYSQQPPPQSLPPQQSQYPPTYTPPTYSYQKHNPNNNGYNR